MAGAQQEYGATPEQVAALQEAVEQRYLRLRRSGKLLTVSVDELRGLFLGSHAEVQKLLRSGAR